MQEEDRRLGRRRRCRKVGLSESYTGVGGSRGESQKRGEVGKGFEEQRKKARRRSGRRQKKGKSVIRVGTGGVVGEIRGALGQVEAEKWAMAEGQEEKRVERKREAELLQQKRARESVKRSAVKRTPGQKRSRLDIGKGPVEEERPKLRQEEKKGKRVRVGRAWVSGRLTNHRKYVAYVKGYRAAEKVRRRREGRGYTQGQGRAIAPRAQEERTKADRWYAKHRKRREGWLSAEEERPGRIVFRNPAENEVGRHEARRCGVPTVGRVTAARSPERQQKRTYVREWPVGEEGMLRIGQRFRAAWKEQEKKRVGALAPRGVAK
jgi:hypothetical protein